MSPFRLQIITPEQSFAEKELSSATFEAESGRLTVLTDHQAMICALAEGEAIFETPSGRETWQTGKGVLKVDSNEVTVLVHWATMADSKIPAAKD